MTRLPERFSRIVVLESPYAGPTPEAIERNLRYLRAGMRECLLAGEVPIASHALYTQPGVLDDSDPAERDLGIRAGFFLNEALFRNGRIVTLGDGEPGRRECSVRTVPVVRVVLTDLGTASSGVARGIRQAEDMGQIVERRSLRGKW